MKDIESLRQEITATEHHLSRLKDELAVLEQNSTSAGDSRDLTGNGERRDGPGQKWPLSLEEYKRYGRQMIVPQVGIQGAIWSLLFQVLIVCRRLLIIWKPQAS